MSVRLFGLTWVSARAGAWGLVMALCALGCGAAEKPSNTPGYSAYTESAPAEDNNRQGIIDAERRAEATKPSATWPHTEQVWSWHQVSRGNTSGHVFAGAPAATVSTRVSNPDVLGVLSGAKTWAELEPGAMISQLVLHADDPNSWVVAFVAERRQTSTAVATDAFNDGRRSELGATSFYLVSREGVIDRSAQDLCAACHAQRSR